MLSTLSRALGLNANDQQSIGRTTGKIKSVAEFLSDAVKAFKDTGWLAKLAEICPWWLQAAGQAAAEAAPPIKFLAEFVGKLGQIREPDQLAYLAFTTAYQRSVEKALRAVGPPKSLPREVSWDPGSDIRTPSEGMTFQGYSLTDPLNHPFLAEADKILEGALLAIGYDPDERRRAKNEVAMRFPGALKSLLTHPTTRDRFAALSDAFRFGSTEERIRAAWQDHFEYQRYLFEDKPVFSEEPFALADVYVDTQCGALRWQDVVDARSQSGRTEQSHGQVVSAQKGHALIRLIQTREGRMTSLARSSNFLAISSSRTQL